MNKRRISIIAGIVLLLIFASILFIFQVRQSQVAVVTTFGSYSRTIEQPGIQFKLPWPIQKVYRFDNRLQNFERKFEQTTTGDAKPLIIEVYVGWRISDPKIFLERFNGDMMKAEQNLESLVRDAKNSVIGQHPFRDLISPREEDLKFDDIEAEIVKAVQTEAKDDYGIDVQYAGIKQLGLPESNTQKVFERMRADRQRLVKQFQGEGESRAMEIRSKAEAESTRILNEARAQAIEIEGQAEAQANEYYKVFQENPELAELLLGLEALEAATKEKTTIVADPNTPPFNLFREGVAELKELKSSK
ncbi:MAG: protease modulator HflC [Verrucomicrobiota bacterium]|jgi:membrane protease subunit HflC|nr:protease modulator HflC [Verrucomicrobiota bacterium]